MRPCAGCLGVEERKPCYKPRGALRVGLSPAVPAVVVPWVGPGDAAPNR
jgi:hypothetical protein